MLSSFCANQVGPDAVFPLAATHEAAHIQEMASAVEIIHVFRRGHYGRAAQLLLQASQPERSPLQSILLAACLFHAGKLIDAEAVLTDMMPPTHGSSLAHCREAGFVHIALAQNRLPDAVAQVEAGLQTWPDSIEFAWLFGRLCIRLNEHQAAQAVPQLLAAKQAPEALIEAFLLEMADNMTPPSSGDSEEAVAQAGRREPRRWGRSEIAIYCGRVGHNWSPKSLADGIGGSEEAVIRLARQLTQRGWQVTVFNEPGTDAGNYEGVRYMPLSAFNPDDELNILVSWRTLGCFDLPLKAAFSCLWLHDIPNPEQFSESRIARMDAVLTLSAFHRSCLPKLPDSLFWVSGNGLDVSELAALETETVTRDPFRCIYASSYERGLEVLLTCWPEVKQNVPQASLHVFYGWESFQSRAKDPAFQKWKRGMDALMEQPGIVHHGRVGHDVIWRETLRSGLWAYPSIYPETSCITAMKAQAAGAIPVVFSYAALEETVQFGLKIPTAADGTPSDRHRDQYTRALIGGLTDHAWQEQVRAPMMAWARSAFSWSGIADAWDTVFHGVLARRDDTARAA